jgi:hypothetical protein
MLAITLIFVQGCLAAVMASLYDYEDVEQGQHQAATVHSQHGLNASDSFYEGMHDDDSTDNEVDNQNDCVEAVITGSHPKKHVQQQPRPIANTSGVTTRQTERAASMPIPSSANQSRREAATALSQTRHRQRRYMVLSKLLASSAELLQLDKLHGRGLLPVLDKLLVPTTKRRPGRKRTLSPDTFTSEEEFLRYHVDVIEHLRPFLEGLGRGAGLRCLAMFLLQHLLHSPKGYDARVRHALKTVGVLVLVHDALLERNDIGTKENGSAYTGSTGGDLSATRHESESIDVLTLASRKFESLERFVAVKLVEMSKTQRPDDGRSGNSGRLTSRGMGVSSRDKIIRGLKIGGTAVAAGTLFAITGGFGK